MGNCLSEEQLRSRGVEENLKKAELVEKNKHKLLLLGTGESGKSTFFKQIQCLYGLGLPRDYRVNSIPSIHFLIIQAIHILMRECKSQGLEIDPKNQEVFDRVEKLEENAPITKKTAPLIKQVWEDSAIQKTFARQATANHSFYLPDATDYFIKQLDVVSDKLYIPSNKDMFRIRTPTTGILETSFMLNGAKFLLVDVGGQRNERRKWIHCFENVRSVIFVVAVSEYDIDLYEESNVNRMKESFDTFDESVNQDCFIDTPIILFLNKMDLYEWKVSHVPISKYVPEFSGPDYNFRAGIDFFQRKFTNLNKNSERLIYVHYTNALDTKKVKKVFNAVRHDVLRSQLKDIALL